MPQRFDVLQKRRVRRCNHTFLCHVVLFNQAKRILRQPLPAAARLQLDHQPNFPLCRGQHLFQRGNRLTGEIGRKPGTGIHFFHHVIVGVADAQIDARRSLERIVVQNNKRAVPEPLYVNLGHIGAEANGLLQGRYGILRSQSRSGPVRYDFNRNAEFGECTESA